MIMDLVKLLICISYVQLALSAPQKEELTATSVIVEPYLEDINNNETYTGMVADVLKEMESLPDFEYRFHFIDVAGKKENGQLPEVAGKSWEYMMDALLNQTVNLIAAPLTETQSREKKLDFTYPFHFSEAMLVMNKEKSSPTTMQQLFESDTLIYGTVANGWLFSEMYNSGDKMLESMARKMLDTHGSLKSSNTEGLYAVRNNKNFVFIMEGSAARLAVTKQPCILQAHSTGLFKRRYAFAVSNQSPLRDPLNSAIFRLKELGILETLDRQYFPSVCESSAMTVSSTVVMLITCIIFSWL